jgi:hypothetical protein
VKYHVFALILALCRAQIITDQIRQWSSSCYSAYHYLIGLVIIWAQHAAKIRAKSLIVSGKNFFSHRAPMQWNGSFWPKYHTILWKIDSILKNKACSSILLKESNYRPYRVCIGCSVNNWLKVWVCKLSFLKRHPSIQKSKILKYRSLIAVKEKKTPSVGYTPAHWLMQYRKKNDPNSRLSMELNCRPQLGLFELNCWNFEQFLSIYTSTTFVRWASQTDIILFNFSAGWHIKRLE